jgi:peroxin-19
VGSTDVASATARAVAASSAVRGTQGLGMGANADDSFQDALSKIIGDIKDPEFQSTLEQTLREMGSGAGNSTAGGADHAATHEGIAANIFQSLAVESGTEGAESVAKTLEILQKLSLEADNVTNATGAALGGPGSSGSSSAMEGVSDEVIEKMMKEFEALGQKEDFAGVVDNMMRQLLNKDIMYLPMKSICEKFPQWLAKNADGLTKDEYEK